MTRFAAAVSLAFATTTALGVEPVYLRLSEALQRGEVAFVGRVIGAEEIAREPPSVVRVRARIDVVRCLYGRACNAQRVTLTYPYASPDDREAETVFDVGAQYVFVLRRDAPEGDLTFDTRRSEGWSDQAYEIATNRVPFAGGRSETLAPMWGSAPEAATSAELEQWAAARKRSRAP